MIRAILVPFRYGLHSSCLALLALTAGCGPRPAAEPASSAKPAATAPAPAHPLAVTALNDHILYFFDGRDPSGKRFSADWNWLDDAAMKLGVGTYVIHQGDRALVYDTFTQPDQARWVRDTLEKMGIRHFTVAYSHWHLDHVGGSGVWADVDVIGTQATRDTLVRSKADIEAGKTWGPPPITPLTVPNITFADRLDFYVGDIKVEMHRIDIHSFDTNVLYLPAEKTLFCGDALEDVLTYMVEIGDLPEHVRNLRKLREWDIARIYPNHGDPKVVTSGGYDKTFIDATIGYVSKMLAHSHDKDFLDGKMEDYVGESLAKGWVHLFEPYRDVHKQNLKLVSDYWKSRPLPRL